MSIFNFLFGTKPKTATLAKERLQLIIAHQRSENSSGTPDYLPALQKELVQVISKYVTINPGDISVQVQREGNVEMLEVNIVLGNDGR